MRYDANADQPASKKRSGICHRETKPQKIMRSVLSSPFRT